MSDVRISDVRISDIRYQMSDISRRVAAKLSLTSDI